MSSWTLQVSFSHAIIYVEGSECHIGAKTRRLTESGFHDDRIIGGSICKETGVCNPFLGYIERLRKGHLGYMLTLVIIACVK